MFIVYKNAKSKSNCKKKKIFAQENSSPLKTQEKLGLSNNFSSFMTNNSYDSEKVLTNFLRDDQNVLNNITPKNDFLSKKIRFHIAHANIQKEQPEIIHQETGQVISSKNKKSKIIIQSTEDDVNEGRWDSNEHMRFLEAINIFGNQWKEVQKFIGTRSSKQVRSHAQKFFMKLKTFKDLSLGIDFTLNSIKNFSNIIDIIKEVQKENNSTDLLFILNQKLLERNIRKNTDSLQNNDDAFIVNDIPKDNNNESMNKNQNINNSKEFLAQKKYNNKFLVNNTFNKKRKKIVKFYKIKNNKNNKSRRTNDYVIKNNQIKEEEKSQFKEISSNKKGSEEVYYEIEDLCNNIISANFNDISNNSNIYECETNDKYFSPISYYMKEVNTISLINRNYYC